MNPDYICAILAIVFIVIGFIPPVPQNLMISAAVLVLALAKFFGH